MLPFETQSFFRGEEVDPDSPLACIGWQTDLVIQIHTYFLFRGFISSELQRLSPPGQKFSEI